MPGLSLATSQGLAGPRPGGQAPHRIGSPGRRSPHAPHRAADSRSRQVAVNSNPLRSRVPYTREALGAIARRVVSELDDLRTPGLKTDAARGSE